MHYQNERNYGCRVSDAWSYRGLKTAVVENELLRIVILIDKGADIYQFVHKPSDVDFVWRSPWGVRDPSKFVQTSGGAAEMWLDQYEGGWQTVLPGGGFPSTHGGVELGLHAEVNTVPWDAVIVEDTPERVSIRCSVRTARTPFYYEKTHTLIAGSSVLHTDETLVNEGRETQHAIWGQHIAIGEPFLNSDCVIDLPGGTLLSHPVEFHPDNRLKPGVTGEWPWGEDLNGDRIDMSRLPPRDSHIYDMSYVTDMPEGWYAVTNQKLGVGFGVSFPKDLYKYLWYWQSFGGSGYPWYGRTYNVGLEPFTSWDNMGLVQAVENGTALTLEAGQRITTSHKAVAYTGSERVQRIAPDGGVSRVS
jgi:hypothetical protein